MNFKNQTVVITGAAGNLGRAVAHAFAAGGANLALLDLDRERLTQLYGQENAQRMHLAVNLLEQDQVAAAVASVRTRFARIDVLCNVAGGFRMGHPVHATPEQDWDFLFNLNVRSLRNMVSAIVPGMLDAGGGKIVNVGANSAQRGVPQMAAYGASKDVVIRLTEAMAAELRDRNINVNCILPSIIDTPENRSAMPDADPERWVTPEALAEVITFLAGSGARAINGAAIPVVGLS